MDFLYWKDVQKLWKAKPFKDTYYSASQIQKCSIYSDWFGPKKKFESKLKWKWKSQKHILKANLHVSRFDYLLPSNACLFSFCQWNNIDSRNPYAMLM